MHESECRRHPIDIVSEDFLERHRAGERPALEEYTARYPDLADEIRELFPLLLEMEQMRPSSGNSDRTNAGPFPAAPAAKQFGDYRIVREIGRGGMGIVYEAEQISLGRRVALKILPPQMLANPKHHRRFEREARAAAKLHHTNIVPVFGVGHKADEHYYVMQFIAGLGLDEVIRELQRMKIDGSESSGGPVDDSLEAAPQVDATAEQVARSLVTGRFEHTLAWDHEPDDSSHTADSLGKTPSPARSSSSESSQTGSSRNWTASSSHSLMPPGDGSSASGTRRQRQAYWHNVANVGRQVAEALHYAHEQGVLHRDIKPSNLLLDMGGTVWITDFGLAKVADQQDLTHSGDILGTLRYLAPEALQGRADARSDLFSLGLTLYELTALRPAFDDTDPRQLIQQVSSGDPPRLDRLDPRIPRDLVTIVHKAIDRDISHRYQTAEDMAADLVRFLNDEPIRARRLSSIERLARWSRRNRGLAASLGSMAILLVVGLIASVITAGHFRLLEKTQRDLANEKSALAASMSTLAGEKTELAERMTRLAEEKSELAAAMQQLADERTRIAVRAREAEKREADLRGEAEEEAETRRRDVYFSDMFLGGHAASEQFSFFQTASLLDKWKPQPGLPDLRDWEWYYLDGQQHKEARTLSFREKNDWVFDVGWSPDGKQVLAAGLTRDGSQPGRPLVVWDVASGQVATQIFEDTLHRANVATWSPDGQYFAAGFYGYEFVHVYESSSGRLAKRFRTLGNNASDIDWTPDGARLVANGGNRVQVWDFHQECELLNLPAVKACSLSPSGEEIAVIHPDKVTVHSMSSGQVLRTLDDSPTGFSQPGASRGWSPDGTTLAVISSRNSVVLMDASSGELLGELSGHGASIWTVDWSPDGTRLLTSGSDSTLRIWDRDTATSVAIIRGHGNVVLGGRWSPDGQYIASGSWDGTVRIWDVEKVLEPAVIPASRRRITRVRFHPTQHQVASSGNDGILRLWRPGAAEPTHQISGHAGRVPALAYSRDGNRLASAGSDGTVRLWRTQDGTPLATLRADEGLSDVDWDADGKRIAAVTHGGQIKIWDVDSGNELLSVRHTVNPDPYLAWDLKGRILFGGIWQPPQIMDPSTGTLLSTSLPQLGPTTAFRLNFDRSLYGVCHEHPVASVYKVAPTLEKVMELSAHPVGATTICFSPDGARVATGGTGGEVRVWDAATGAATLTIQAHQVAVRSIDWSPDGLRIVSAADDGTIAYHDASTGFMRNQSARALPELNRWVEESDKAVEALRARAAIRARRGEADAAEADLQRAFEILSARLRKSPDSDEVLLAWISFVLHTAAEQKVAENTVVCIDPDFLQQFRQEWVELAALPWRQAAREVGGVVARAKIHALTTRFDSNPADVHALFARAKTHFQIGKRDLAQADLAAAIEIIEREFDRRRDLLGIDSPETLSAMQWLAHAYGLSGDIDRALALATPLLQLDPTEKSTREYALRALRQVWALAIQAERPADAAKIDAAYAEILRDGFSDYDVATVLNLVWAGADKEHHRLCARLRDTVDSDRPTALATWAACVLIHPSSPVELRQQAVEALKQALAPDKNLRSAQIASGMARYREGDFAAARTQLGRLIARAPESVETAVASAFQAMAAFRLGDAETAARLLADAERRLGNLAVAEVQSPYELNIEPKLGWLAVREARRLIGSGALAPAEAIDRLLQLQTFQAERADYATQPAMHLAVLQAWFERFDDHAATCERLLARTDSYTDPSHFDQAAKAYLIHPSSDPSLLPAACDSGRRSLKLGADHAYRSWYEYVAGLAEYRLGNTQEALQRFEGCIASNNQSVRVPSLLYRGLLRVRQGEFTGAWEDLLAAESEIPPLPDRVRPTEAVLKIDQMIVWMAYEEVVDDFVKQIDQMPQVSDRLQHVSDWRHAIGQWKQQAVAFAGLRGQAGFEDPALDRLRARLESRFAPKTELRIDDPTVYLAGASRLAKQGRGQEAEKLLDAAMQDRTDDGDLLAQRAGVFEELGRGEEALADWTRLLEQRPGNREALARRAFLLTFQLRRYQEALDDWNVLLEKPHQNADHLRFRGICYVNLGRWDESLADLEEAVRLAPADRLPEFRCSLALHYWLPRGQWSEATPYMAEVLQYRGWRGWEFAREVMLHSLLVENRELYADAVAEFEQRALTSQGDWRRWLVLAYVLEPGKVTEDNDRRLRALAAECPDPWPTRLEAALDFRMGKYDKALESDDPCLQFFAAIASFRLDNEELARKQLANANAWMRAQHESGSAQGVPAGLDWQEWAALVILQREAETLFGQSSDTDVPPQEVASG